MISVSYYPGCSLHGTAREYAESTEAVCKTLEIDLKELADWNCCGSSSAHVASDSLATALPARNLEIASRAGMDVLVPCAACYQRLKYAQKELLAGKPVEGITGKFEGEFSIKHVVEFMWEDVGEKTLSSKVKKPLKGIKPVCYYGCLTTRPPSVTDHPNSEDPQSMDKILTCLGADVRNWSYKTDCCGGNLILTRPDIALKMVKKLFKMAKEAGANCIVTGCPMCFSNLDSWQKRLLQENGEAQEFPIFYISELMGVAFGDPGVKKWLGRHTVDPRPLLRQEGLI